MIKNSIYLIWRLFFLYIFLQNADEQFLDQIEVAKQLSRNMDSSTNVITNVILCRRIFVKWRNWDDKRRFMASPPVISTRHLQSYAIQFLEKKSAGFTKFSCRWIKVPVFLVWNNTSGCSRSSSTVVVLLNSWTIRLLPHLDSTVINLSPSTTRKHQAVKKVVYQREFQQPWKSCLG